MKENRELPPKQSLPLFAVLLTGAALISGCAHVPRVSTTERDDIYMRAEVQFHQTVLLKPEESERPEFLMAPLIVQAITSTNNLPPLPAAIYFWRTVGVLQNQPVEQFNYVWFYPVQDKSSRRPQGVRVTMNPEGKPVIWEILRDDTGARIFYVSQSLEASAMTNHPVPLAGRRYWVERSIEETPNIIVARIIDDSATPMGPTLYLEAGSPDVATLICRCMDAQADEVAGTGIYGLARLDEAAVRWLVREKEPSLTRWLPGKPADKLDDWLRIGSR